MFKYDVKLDEKTNQNICWLPVSTTFHTILASGWTLLQEEPVPSIR
jgi:hypothetical protein